MWEKRANPESLGVADGIISLIPSTDGPPRVTYNMGHVAAGTSGRNFLWLHPRRSPYCHIDLRVGNERRAGLVERIGEVDLAMGTVRDDSIMWLKLTLKELEANKDMLRQAIHEAEELSRS